SSLFKQQGLPASVVHTIASIPKLGKMLARIRPGETLEFRMNTAGELTQFRYVQSKLKSIFFSKTDDGYKAELISRQPQTRITYAQADIENSLFVASQKAGLPDKLTMKLAGIFGWDIDFVQDIRRGDSFNLIYEEKYLNDEKLENGNILAANFINQGKTYTAIRYTDSRGNSGYYSTDGQSMRKAFLRTPVDFTRISSRFNPNRLHPVFKTKRPHRGVDYAASTRTPIKAAGDGRVKFAGWQNGYGNVVYLQHPNNIVTVYAHQHKIRRGLKKGQMIKQGQTIGYVGQTGWATGPHLHYEFRVNGVHRNPVTVKLPDASPIPKKEMARFKGVSQRMLAQLETVAGTMLAQQ
ncbi:peptidoglycan DD-metalloendopeptidase family protein, partial [Endozoicomonas sp.]|nr:peptidoglycan DD-metalloendopeptidase family protein [Endozoicomonas sp.]